MSEVINWSCTTSMPSLQQIHSGIQKVVEINGETHVLMLLVKDDLEKVVKGQHIQNKYNVSRDFIHKIHLGK